MESVGGLMYRSMMSAYQGKRVFVTGHTGFKGSWLCRILVDAGAHVTGYALPPQAESGLLDRKSVV